MMPSHLRSSDADEHPIMTRRARHATTPSRHRWTTLRTALVAPLVLGLTAAGLAGCTKESVTPAQAPVAYVALGATVPNPGSTVAVINTVTGALGKPIAVGTLPSAVALLPGGKDLLVTVKADDQLVEVSTSTGKVVRRVGVGLEPDAVAVTPDGATALVANFGNGTVTAVRLDTFTITGTVPVGRQPVAVAVTPDGTRALVANYQDGTLTPIALPALTGGPPVAVGPEPTAVFISSNGATALVAGFQTSSITPVSLPTLSVGAPVSVGANPTGIAAAPGSPIALAVSRNNYNSVLADLSLRAEASVTNKLAVWGQIGATSGIGDDPQVLTARFVKGSRPFQASADGLSADSVYLGLGASYKISDSISVALGYRVEYRSEDGNYNGVSLSSSFRF